MVEEVALGWKFVLATTVSEIKASGAGEVVRLDELPCVAVAGVRAGLTGGLELTGLELSGAPTAISHRCPGSPCFGFNPDEVLDPALIFWFNVMELFAGMATGVAVVVVVVLEGALLRGAPTAISQRWPGSPCFGLRPCEAAETGMGVVCCCIRGNDCPAGFNGLLTSDARFGALTAGRLFIPVEGRDGTD